MLAETGPADPGNGIQDTLHAGYGLVLCARGEGAVPGDWRARREHMQYAGGGRGTLETGDHVWALAVCRQWRRCPGTWGQGGAAWEPPQAGS